MKHVAVSDAEAVELGYDAPEIRRRMAREIDAPLAWRDRRPGGEAAQGYDVNTRIEAEVSSGGFVSVAPDPKYCDGTSCRLEDREEPLEQSECSSYLEAPIVVTFRTLDGAVSGTAQGKALQWHPDETGLPSWFPGSAVTDLRDVVGTLRLSSSDTRKRALRGYLAVTLTFDFTALEK